MLCHKRFQYMSCLLAIFASLLLATDALRIEVDEDPRVQGGKSVELVCKARRVDDEVDRCFWYGPDGTKYTAQDEDSDEDDDRNTRRGSRSNVEAILFVDDDECVLKINSVGSAHNGPWECFMEERRDDEPASKFIFLRVSSVSEKLAVNLDPDQRQLSAKVGSTVQLICPTNAKVTDPRSYPQCSWISPKGKLFRLVGK